MKKEHAASFPRKFLALLALALAGTALAACSCGNAPEENAAPAKPARTAELLSRHDADAVFAGTREHVCRGLTALCPDRCGRSGTLAVFRVEKYNAYEKPGQYGDPQTDEFAFMLLSTTGASDVPAEIAERVHALAPGDKVRLVWEHVYVTDENGSSFPERVVRELSARR
ncbi:hypothetical protein [Candidatus Spyradosoma sp. SGI.093]|uniref:hypothetical protein n=1 Tax=Candidatus Spyradosoma sp. SGI.093 TaxID=3420583 RepID=UPI003CFD3B68